MPRPKWNKQGDQMALMKNAQKALENANLLNKIAQNPDQSDQIGQKSLK